MESYHISAQYLNGQYCFPCCIRLLGLQMNSITLCEFRDGWCHFFGNMQAICSQIKTSLLAICSEMLYWYLYSKLFSKIVGLDVKFMDIFFNNCPSTKFFFMYFLYISSLYNHQMSIFPFLFFSRVLSHISAQYFNDQICFPCLIYRDEV